MFPYAVSTGHRGSEPRHPLRRTQDMIQMCIDRDDQIEKEQSFQTGLSFLLTGFRLILQRSKRLCQKPGIAKKQPQQNTVPAIENSTV